LLVFGRTKCFGHLCQKHPSTNTTGLYRGKITSGLPSSLF
jgi:hypothetical protein